MAEEPQLFKDRLAGPEVEWIADTIVTLHPSFSRSTFVDDAMDGLTALELKDRVRHIIAALHVSLPEDFRETAKILYQVPDAFDPADPDDRARGFALWPLIDFVGIHGASYPEVALPLLRRLTGMFSAEFAIRPFIQNDQTATLSELDSWTDDPSHHVRRLVSEGTRPRLPWGMRLNQLVEDPAPIIPLLEKLRDDRNESVRRSVANNLNDIAKDHPDLVVSICQKWSEDADETRRRLIRHALRTLIKTGHPGVFPLLGFTADPKLEVGSLRVANEKVSLGGHLEFELSLKSLADEQRFVVDFAIHFVKANGSTAAKVFKLRNVKAAEGESITIRKKHPIKPISTRRYYAGEHMVAVHINGCEIARTSFMLEV